MRVTLNTNQYNTQQSTNNQNKKNNTSFKGHTEGAVKIIETKPYYSHYSPNTYIAGYKLQDRATPNYKGAYPNKYTKVYVADPFEIISEDKYKTHDFTVRNDLRLSDIKNSYKNGYQNFAKNAYDEINYLQYLYTPETTNKNIENNKLRIQALRERADFNQNDKYVNEFYQKKIDKTTQDIQNDTIKLSNHNKQIDTAKKRYDLLLEMDTIGPKYHHANRLTLRYTTLHNYETPEQAITGEYANASEVFKTHKDKKSEYKQNLANEQDLKKQNEIKAQYRAYKANAIRKISEIRKKIQLAKEFQGEKQKLPAFEKALEECMKKIEVFYKANYPTWL